VVLDLTALWLVAVVVVVESVLSTLQPRRALVGLLRQDRMEHQLLRALVELVQVVMVVLAMLRAQQLTARLVGSMVVALVVEVLPSMGVPRVLVPLAGLDC
jgi:hypothetical protein